MSDPILEYLNTISITHEYLNLSNRDIPILHNTVVIYTESPNISLSKYKFINESSPIESSLNYDELYDINKYKYKRIKPFKINNEIKIRLYMLQLRLEIIMSEFRLANGTISRLKDLFGQLGIQEEISPLALVITLRSELLEVEAYIEANYSDSKNNENNNNDNEKLKLKSPFDSLVIMKNVVNSYIDKSCEVVIQSVNRDAALSVTSSGIESIRNSIDLYSIQKRKSNLDKNVAELTMNIKIDKESNKFIINPEIIANESINALIELLKMRPLDVETYLELSNIYLLNGKIKESLYCIGESLLSGCSGAWNIWSLRGELCQIQSNCILSENKRNKLIAKSWLFASIASFSHSLEICSDFIRAWCGLYVSLQKLSNLQINDIDPIYIKMKMITLRKINEFKIDKSIPIMERENINWILENY
ncbi:hypothetical protein C6P40_000573 [Pichia californica]|uniref:Uncharacterized protein n=1 Tax=Pichia californica TaxID=460514 RepID=A0A9P6WKT2_9ASCO|nr:hypothetical protein C6P42_000529 [[Candida] californica]KAG0688739.1 hypothetical protein C6P40_000573 [[Candida] californica]